MALQELNLAIENRSGKHNGNADALSRYPLPDSTDDTQAERLVAALTPMGDREKGDDLAEENNIATLQRVSTELAPLIEYLETGTLPQNDKDARRIVLSSGQFTLDVLYRVENDGTLRLFPQLTRISWRTLATQKCIVSSGDTTGGWGCVETLPSGQEDASSVLL